MRDERKVIALSILAGLSFWLIDALIDPLLPQRHFLEVLLFGGSTHDLIMRLFILVLFICLGAVISRFVARHRRAEEALAEKTVYLDSILKSAREYAISTTDKDFRITYYNPLAEKLHGYSAKEVIGKTVQEMHLLDRIGPEALEKAKKEILERGEHTYLVERKTPEGTVYIESRVSGIFDRRNELIGYANFSRDVTSEMNAQAERERLIAELKEALAEVKTLSGLLPICSYCKKIRDDRGYWSRIETYISRHSEAEFTHSICPECEKKILDEGP